MTTPRLDEIEGTPSDLIRLQIILLVGTAVREHLGELRAASVQGGGPDWNVAIESLARICASEISQVTDEDPPALACSEIWGAFLHRPTILRCSADLKLVLTRIQERIPTLAACPGAARRLLGDANSEARARTRDLLSGISAVDRLDSIEAELDVETDRLGDQAAARSNFPLRRITWSLRWDSIALWSAIALVPLLQHEYLSHFAVRSQYLGYLTREVWLMHVLERQLDELAKDEDSRASERCSFLYVRDEFSGVDRQFNKRLRYPLEYGLGRLLPQKGFAEALTADLLSTDFSEAEAARAERVLERLALIAPLGLALLADHRGGILALESYFSIFPPA